MPAERLSTLIRRLRRAADPGPADGLSDAQLLGRFVRCRDQAAFELLVWRHGPMVLSVCRRVLRREHDAEDAFQAAFLTLVRKARGIGRRASVGGWLYKVAYRIALRARAAARTVPLPEEPLPDASAEEPIAGLLSKEWSSALDEEVHRLPEKYRLVFILCHLEGRTTAAAAGALGCPQGTVGVRLARARELLRRRLSRRGFDGSAAPGAVAPALPAALVDSAIKAALLGTAEKAAAAGAISARAAALTKGALRTMSLTRWMLTAAAVLALGLLGGGAVLLARPAADGQPAPAVKAAPNPPADPKDAGAALQWRFEKGKPFYEEWDVETRQAMKVQDNDILQDQKQTFTFRWMPERQDDDGWVLTQKIEGLKTALDMGGNKIEFDSTKDGNGDRALSNFCKALVGAEFRVTLDEADQVRKVDGRDEIARKLDASSPALNGRLAQRLADAAVDRSAGEIFAALPGKPVRPNDSWTRTVKMGAGGPVECQAEYTYTYKGREGDLDVIMVEVALKDPSAPEGSPFKVKNIELKRADGAGVVLFDREKGRVVRQELTLKLEGKVTHQAPFKGGPEMEVELNQTQKSTLRTTDADPLPSAGRDEDKAEIERLRRENERLRQQLKAVEEALKRDGKP